MNNHYNTIYQPVRSECSSCRGGSLEPQIQIQIFEFPTSDLTIAGVQPGNVVKIQTICYCFHPGISWWTPTI